MKTAFRTAGLLSLCAVSLLAHFILISDQVGPLLLLVITLQIATGAWLISRKLPLAYRILVVLVLSAAGLAAFFYQRDMGVLIVSGLPHALAYGGLLLFFSLSLLPGREPVASYLARRIHGTTRESVCSYTRKVTIAWCGFFLLQLLASGLLLLLAPMEYWSIFVNILNFPLLLLAFVAERLARPFLLANAPKESPAQMRRMWELLRQQKAGGGHFTSPGMRAS